MAAQVLSLPAHYSKIAEKQQTVTTTSAVITPLAVTDAVKGTPENIFVQALSTNTGPIQISSVSPAVAGSIGIELVAGANVNLPGNRLWYVVCTVGTQKLNIMYLGSPA